MTTPTNANNPKPLDQHVDTVAAVNDEKECQPKASSSSEVVSEPHRESNNTNHLQSKQLDQQSSVEYERAIRRALLENEYVRKINSQLLTKLSTATHESEASRENIQKMKTVCESMKELINTLAAAKGSSDDKVQEMERMYQQVVEAEEARRERLEALEVGQQATDTMVDELRQELDEARRERDEAISMRGQHQHQQQVMSNYAAAVAVAGTEEGPLQKTTEVQRLKNEKQQLEGAIATITREQQDKEEKLDAVTSERDGLKVKCDEIQMVLKEKEEELLAGTMAGRTIAKTSEDWETKYTNCNQELNNVTSERDSLKARVDELLSKSSSLELNNTEQRASSLVEKDTEVNNKSQSKLTLQLIAEKEELANKVELLADARRKSEQRWIDTKAEKEELLAAREVLQEKVDTLQSNIVDITASKETEVQNLQQELVRVCASRDEVLTAKDGMEEEIDRLQNNVAEITAAKQTEVTILQQELNSVRASLIATKAEKEELLMVKGAMHEEISTLQSNVAEITAAKTTEIKSLELELGVAQASLNDTTMRKDELSVENVSLQQQIETLQNNVAEIAAAKAAEVKSLQLELGVVQASLNDALIHKDELSAAKEAMQVEINRLQSNVVEITAAKETEVESLQLELASVQASLKNVSMQKDELSAEKEAMQEEINRLLSNVSEITASKETEVDCLKQVLENVRASLSSTQSEKEELVVANGSMEEEIKTLQVNVAEITAAKVTEAANLQHELGSVQASLNDASIQKDKLSAAMGIMQEEINRLQSDVAEITAAKETEVESLQLKMDGLLEEKESMKREIVDVSAKRDELSAANDSMQQQMDSLRRDLVDINAANATEVQDLQNKLGSATSARDELLAEKDAMQHTIDKLEISMAEISASKDKEVGNLQGELESVKTALIDKTASSEAAVRSLQDELVSVQENVKTLTHDLETHQGQLETADESIVRLSEQLNAAQSERETTTKQMSTIMRELALVSDDRSPSMKLRAARAVSAPEENDEAQAAPSMQMKVEENLSLINKMKLNMRSLQTQKTNLLEAAREKTAALHDLESQKQDMAQRIEILSAELKDANETCSKLDDAKKASSQEQERLSAELLDSKQEGQRLTSVVKSMESSHADELAHVEEEKNGLISQKLEMVEQIECLSSKIDVTSEKCSSLSTKLADVMKAACEEQEQFNTKITSLEADLLESKQDSTAKAAEVENLEKVLETSQTEKNGLISQKLEMAEQIECLSSKIDVTSEKCSSLSTKLADVTKAACEEQEQFNTKIISLEADLLESKQDSTAKAADVENLEKELETSQTSLVGTTANRDELSAELSEVKDQLNSLTEVSTMEKKRFEEIVQALETTKQDLVEKEKERCEQIKGLIEQVDNLEVMLEKSEASRHELENKNKEQHAQIVEATIKFTDLEKSLEDKETQIETLSSRLAEVESEKGAAMTEIEELSEELKSTATTLSDVQGLISADQKQATEMKNTIKKAQTENKVLEESILSVKRDRDDFEAKLEFSRQEAEGFRNEWLSSKSIVELMTNQCEQVTRDKDNIEAKLEFSGRLLESRKKECEQLAIDVAELGIKHDAAEALARELRLESQRSIARYRRQEETSQSEIFCLENIVTSLKKEYEAFRVETRAAAAAQIRACEAKLEPLCFSDKTRHQQQDRTFDDMIVMIQKDQADLLQKSRSMSKELEAVQDESVILEQQVHILSKDLSKYKLQNKGMLQALDEITNVKRAVLNEDIPMDEIAVDREVEKRLISFRHKIEM